MGKKKTEKEYLILVEGEGTHWFWDGEFLEEQTDELYLVPESCLKDELKSVQRFMDENEDEIIWNGCAVEVLEYAPTRYIYKTSTLEKK